MEEIENALHTFRREFRLYFRETLRENIVVAYFFAFGNALSVLQHYYVYRQFYSTVYPGRVHQLFEAAYRYVPAEFLTIIRVFGFTCLLYRGVIENNKLKKYVGGIFYAVVADLLLESGYIPLAYLLYTFYHHYQMQQFGYFWEYETWFIAGTVSILTHNYFEVHQGQEINAFNVFCYFSYITSCISRFISVLLLLARVQFEVKMCRAMYIRMLNLFGLTFMWFSDLMLIHKIFIKTNHEFSYIENMMYALYYMYGIIFTTFMPIWDPYFDLQRIGRRAEQEILDDDDVEEIIIGADDSVQPGPSRRSSSPEPSTFEEATRRQTFQVPEPGISPGQQSVRRQQTTPMAITRRRQHVMHSPDPEPYLEQPPPAPPSQQSDRGRSNRRRRKRRR